MENIEEKIENELESKLEAGLEDIQKRNAYRLDRKLPMKFMKSNRKDIKDGETKNISEGGILFDHDYVLRENDILKISIDIENKKITAEGVIVRIEKLREGSTHKFRYSVKFINIQPNTQDALAKYIWKEQLKKR